MKWDTSTGRRRRIRRTGCSCGEGAGLQELRCPVPMPSQQSVARMRAGDSPETRLWQLTWGGRERGGRRNCCRLSMCRRLPTGERLWNCGPVPLSWMRSDQLTLRPVMASRRPSSSPSSFAMRSRSWPNSRVHLIQFGPKLPIGCRDRNEDHHPGADHRPRFGGHHHGFPVRCVRVRLRQSPQ